MEKKIRIAGIVILNDRLLMLANKGHVELRIPGGVIELNEQDEECLRRELKEEICVDVAESKFFREYSGHSMYNPNKFIVQRIYITKISGEIIPSMETENYVWLTKEDFENKKYPILSMTESEIIPDLIKEGIW